MVYPETLAGTVMLVAEPVYIISSPLELTTNPFDTAPVAVNIHPKLVAYVFAAVPINPLILNPVIEPPLQPVNTPLPIVDTVYGIVIVVRALHPEKALSPISVTDVGTVTPVIVVQSLNALSPTFVTA